MPSISRLTISLFRFMLIFNINRFWILAASPETIKARVGWPDEGSPDYDADEEVQDIEWTVQHFENLDDALLLSEYLIDNQLIRGDKIVTNIHTLAKRITWDEKRYESALKTLLSVRVDVIDDGRKTDYFFVHT